MRTLRGRVANKGSKRKNFGGEEEKALIERRKGSVSEKGRVLKMRKERF